MGKVFSFVCFYFLRFMCIIVSSIWCSVNLLLCWIGFGRGYYILLLCLEDGSLFVNWFWVEFLSIITDKYYGEIKKEEYPLGVPILKVVFRLWAGSGCSFMCGRSLLSWMIYKLEIPVSREKKYFGFVWSEELDE